MSRKPPQNGSPTLQPSKSSPPPSAAAHALSNISGTIKRPGLRGIHSRNASWTSPPLHVVESVSSSAVPVRSTFEVGDEPYASSDKANLLLYTYKPNATASAATSQPSPLPSRSTFNIIPASTVLFAHASLPWRVRPGEYLEMRQVVKTEELDRGMGGHGPEEVKAGGEALKGLKKRGKGHDSFVFRVGEDSTNIQLGQIHVPESVASAFEFRVRSEVEIIRVHHPLDVSIDYVELRFSQYLGRADMWRLGMSLENSTIHVGERLSLAGGAVRAEIVGIWRGERRYASGIFTAKTKTIYRSRSAQVYIFIQLCQETWEFDEDGERYSEKVVHGFLPELFARWGAKATSHLVTIIFFARVYYNPQEVEYMQERDLTMGLTKDYAGRACKDFFKVAIDFERRNDWKGALSEVKQALERSEKEILLDFHLKQAHDDTRILGRWSFAYEGNFLEAVNLALNPFDEHYIDRDLSRTGLTMTIITPGTGHFAVDKNLLRLTTERMIDHGIGLDLVCLTKMPLHSVPLFSYVSERPNTQNGKLQTSTPDLLYFDAQLQSDGPTELADCYSIPKWIAASFYSKTHDKPFRKDRFVPRCKMYEIQMLGILDHNLTTVTVPFLPVDDTAQTGKGALTAEQRRLIRESYDAATFRPVPAADGFLSAPPSNHASFVGAASYQSARLLAAKSEENQSSLGSDHTSSARLGTVNGVSPVLSARSDGQRTSRTALALPPLDLQRTELRPTSPAPSSLSMGLTARARSPPPPVEESTSGASTPKHTPSKKLRNKSSKSSFTTRFGSNWLLSAITGRSQISFPIAAAETVIRPHVSSVTGSAMVSPTNSPSEPRPVPGAPFITPSTPSPARDAHYTQPLPIAARRAKMASDDDLAKSHKNSIKLSRSPGDSWAKAANLSRGNSHIAVNPCNPRENLDAALTDSRRWQHLRPKSGRDSHHHVKWTSLTAPACLPLTTDFMPTPADIQEFYELHSYDIACYPDQVSFLVRADAAHVNLPLAVMREMASQRLSQNFQFIVLPHDHNPGEEDDGKASATRRVLLPGDSTKDGLRVGGASEVLRDANGAIYLLWANHIHRLAFDATKQSVTIQRFVRKLRHSMEPVQYTCLVWPSQTDGFRQAEATFKYPNVEAKLNFNYLDRLIAGEEEDLTSSLRYWRTRYLLLPSGKDPLTLPNVVPKGENFDPSEILIAGAFKVLEVLAKYQWTKPGKAPRPMRLLPTTFDPSACVMDDGLMSELERLNEGEEPTAGGKALEGMTLQDVAKMMCQPNNGLVIRDRWWNFNVHEDSFTGEQFCEWLYATFTDVSNLDEAAEWGRSLLSKGLIEHVTAAHGFVNYGHFIYRLRDSYDINRRQRPTAKSWFGGKGASDPRDLIEKHASMSVSPSDNAPLGKLNEKASKKRKIKMSQSVVVDLDPGRRSDRAEVAVLHADVIHNEKNAFHFELNWLGVTAALLDELRNKCATQAERYGLRFVEAPVEQIKDIPLKCAYRAPIPIPLALAPPIVPDLPQRLAQSGAGQPANYFEYAILKEHGFVLDVEAASRYPDTIEVQYSYRGKTTFEYSQFCHRSGLALVQCVGGTDGFLWSDNRLFIAAPTRGRGNTAEVYPNAPFPARMTKQEETRDLRRRLEAFCNDAEELRKFYDKVMPPPLPDRTASPDSMTTAIENGLGNGLNGARSSEMEAEGSKQSKNSRDSRQTTEPEGDRRRSRDMKNEGKINGEAQDRSERSKSRSEREDEVVDAELEAGITSHDPMPPD